MLKYRLTYGLPSLAVSRGVTQADMPQQFGVLEFGPDNTLFVADAVSGALLQTFDPAAMTLPLNGVRLRAAVRASPLALT